MEATLYNQAGEQIGSIELNEAIFGIEPNIPVMHQYVLMQQANARQGTQSTRGRGEVRGSTRKIYRQKGTGRARQGSVRAPHRIGGGIAHGPHPRSYRLQMPKKMRRLAVRSALSAKLAAAQIRVIDSLAIEKPRTKDIVKFLSDHTLSGKTLIVIASKNEQTGVIQRSTNNLPNVKTLLASYLNVRDLLTYDTVVLPKAAIEVIESYLGAGTASAQSEEE
ncbi:50S ribosomal protein L4 [Oscillochloris sp. ZM17-4]|uniref:50S ribosomal protein L4 n=1 Tax=Oscillochloris sp. ZM17-4 TaxID=2866714 RepID=UPI001C73418A|nr:50S ribosomal protein L4 [Oscillochloris sp. ZM17-4]MBX0326893.1 50S ribosomal protein L4 [Oscillochloris sp. ZM17-4]